MAHYRFYVLDDCDHIRTFLAGDYPDDNAAIAVAQDYRLVHPWIELWSGDRKVRRWPPGGFVTGPALEAVAG